MGIFFNLSCFKNVEKSRKNFFEKISLGEACGGRNRMLG
jgi:hypothetical protein